jgi:para-aminobenzoate synthetase component 1
LTHDDYVARVERILEHIRAGDCYQVNLTRTLEWDTEPDPVALFGALTVRGPAPHAMLLRLPLASGPAAVVSASPERFLSWHGAAVETRPIKGTAAVADALAHSAKDHAENVMIVDLARNDLGRVCRTGSIHVPALCATERHPGLAHLVSTVRGERRDDVGLGALLRAMYPAASITGAPKPRVLQLIEDLEPVPRGVYCGAVGWIDTSRGKGDNEGDLAVAIRTFTVAHGRTTLGVGGGIVADSDPEREWDETCLKARRLLRATGAGEPDPIAVPRDGARVSV